MYILLAKSLYVPSGRIHIYVTNLDYGIDKKTGLCSEEHRLAEDVIANLQRLYLLGSQSCNRDNERQLNAFLFHFCSNLQDSISPAF